MGYVVLTRREWLQVTMRRATPKSAVLLQVAQPLVTMVVQYLWLITVFKKTDVGIEIILDVISNVPVSIRLTVS
jgi:hypothetical protein